MNERLQVEKESLERERSQLRNDNEELLKRADRLLDQQQLLEQCTESLKLENTILLQQFDRLKLKHNEENAQLQAQFTELKQQVGSTLNQYAAGEVTAEQLLNFLKEVGVEVHFQAKDFERPQLIQASTTEERVDALSSITLEVGEDWMQRAAHLMLSAHSSQMALISTGSEELMSQPKKLTTPLKLKSTAESVQHEKAAELIPALHLKEEPVAEKNKSRSLLFRPMRKVNKKADAVKEPRLLEMDVPLGAASASVPPLSFDTLEFGGENRSMVAM